MAKNPIKHYTTAVYDHAVDGTITAGTPVVLADSGFVPKGAVITGLTYAVAGAVTGGNVQIHLDPTDGTALVAVGGNTALSTAGKAVTDVRGAIVAKESKFALDCVSTNVTAGKINILIEYVMGLEA